MCRYQWIELGRIVRLTLKALRLYIIALYGCLGPRSERCSEAHLDQPDQDAYDSPRTINIVANDVSQPIQRPATGDFLQDHHANDFALDCRKSKMVKQRSKPLRSSIPLRDDCDDWPPQSVPIPSTASLKVQGRR